MQFPITIFALWTKMVSELINLIRQNSAQEPSISRQVKTTWPDPPMPPIFFFIFDVSPKGTENGSIEMACSILIELINGEQGAWGDSRTKMGFIVYDSNVNILELTPNQKMPKMVTVTDIDSLQKLPIPENLLVNL
jgi:hypothetical protein